MKQVVVKIRGGLGNQLFQYAAGRAAAITLSRPLSLDLSFYDGAQRGAEFQQFRRKPQLTQLRLPARGISGYDGCTNSVPSQNWIFRLLSGVFGNVRSRTMIATEADWPGWHAYSDCRELVLDGYWVSPVYFQQFAEILREEISLAAVESQREVNRLIKQGKNNRGPLIGVHVRRGDIAYTHEVLGNPAERVGYKLLGMDYYQKAMSYFPSGSRFLIFSDDPDWVAKQFQGGQFLVAGKNSEIVDFFTLAGCDHQIIANSTFSWWAAYLNPNTEKQVIGPSRWYHESEEDVDVQALTQSGWICL